ncbi:MAG: T9SS type A sorting domain-containing protein [Chitinophagaceae bacterium]|nr:MAG: T9SS type A sorting domain-containing protein [Chitinophagaceae bacterium]
MKQPSLLLLLAMFTLPLTTLAQPVRVIVPHTREVFWRSNVIDGLQNPWEVTFGPNDSLWITESDPTSTAGYRVTRVHKNGGSARTMLDLRAFSDPNYPSNPTRWQKKFTPTANGVTPKIPSFQGGLMGLALHPEFATNPAKRYVYIAYGHDWVGPSGTVYRGETVNGNLFITWLVRFTEINGTLVNPVALCDTIRGSNDHNSGRIMIRPENGTNYLYYAVGDMGAGQFDNLSRTIKAQVVNSYEGKILRFNLEPDADAAQDSTNYNQWIPNDNPFNAGGVQSAVWALGIRNNQGFAYGIFNGIPRMFGSSHGPFSDDEVNELQSTKNYGHPEIIGYSADGNYDGAKAGPIGSSLPLISSEATRATTMANYKDPLFVNYPAIHGNTSTPEEFSVQYIYQNKTYTGTGGNTAQNRNDLWASEGYSGLDLYAKSKIPGWKNSLLLAVLKRGRVVRLQLNNAGTAVQMVGNVAAKDTNIYFAVKNRFRDLAISPDGTTIVVAYDRSTNSSGPSANNPVIPNCAGCIQKYEFLGFIDSSNNSTVPTYIPVAAGTTNVCETGDSAIINANNNVSDIWIPLTDTNSAMIAEVKTNTFIPAGQRIRTSFYRNTGAVRRDGKGRYYLDRNVTINSTSVSSGNIGLRLYLTTAEYNALRSATLASGLPNVVNQPSDMTLYRSTDNCRSAILNAADIVNGTTVSAFGTSGYVITAAVGISASNQVSSYYIGPSGYTTLPTNLLNFDGHLNVNRVDLNWTSVNEVNAANYIIERSADGLDFSSIGVTKAEGGEKETVRYSFIDREILNQPALILYYRLRMVDNDGKYSYSNIITISLAAVTGRLQVNPNPVTDVASVSISAVANGTATWKLTDNAGRLVMQGRVDLRKGNNFFPIAMKKLAAGLYVLEVSGKGIQQQLKVQKL